MADGDKDEREGLLTTIRARRKWYLGIYALQILGWLILVVFNEVSDVNSTDTVSRRVQDAAVTMSFIAQGTLISTILLIDVVFDGFRYIIKKGAELMGLLFDNFENKFIVRGRKQEREQAHVQINEWVAENPEIKKLIDEGRVSPPPNMDNDRK